MSEQVLGERLSADEVTTTIALHHMPSAVSSNSTLDSLEEVTNHAMAVIRTGAIYIIPGDHLMEAVRQLPPTSELPPLPFPRIVVEGTDKETDKPVVLFLSGEENGLYGLGIKLITIAEAVQGTEWNVVMVLSLEGRQEYFPFAVRREEKGLTTVLHKDFLNYYGKSGDEKRERTMSELQFSAAHLSGFVINLVKSYS